MSELTVGQKIKDNDPRMANRAPLTVKSLGASYVWALYAGREVRIKRERVYTDGKPRRTGFSVVVEDPHHGT